MDDLEIGQAWVYPEIDGAPPLLAAIGALDDIEYDDGTRARIVSVRVVPHPKARERRWTTVGHMPVMSDVFRDGGARLAPQPVELGAEFAHGYDTWRKAFDAGKAGAFTLSVSEAYLAVAAVAARKTAEN